MIEVYTFGPISHDASGSMSRADLEFYGINHYLNNNDGIKNYDSFDSIIHVDFYDNRFIGVNLDRQPSWAAVAQAMGADGVRIENAADVGPAPSPAQEVTWSLPDSCDGIAMPRRRGPSICGRCEEPVGRAGCRFAPRTCVLRFSLFQFRQEYLPREKRHHGRQPDGALWSSNFEGWRQSRRRAHALVGAEIFPGRAAAVRA